MRYNFTASDTRRWADREGQHWPCSTLAGHPLTLEFDKVGLIYIDLPFTHAYEFDLNELDLCELNAFITDVQQGLFTPVLPPTFTPDNGESE